MAYHLIKEKLEDLFTQEISLRSTIQESRRNLFLSGESFKVQQQLLEEKKNEISNLNLLVEKKKSILQIKDEEIKALRERLSQADLQNQTASQKNEEEINYLLEKVTELEQKVIHNKDAHGEIELLKTEMESLSVSEMKNLEEISDLKNFNDELRGKIKEIGDSIEEKDKQREKEQTEIFEQSTMELQKLQERSDLLFESENQLKILVASQNSELGSLLKSNTQLKKNLEDISTGWQRQQEQLVNDNANLLAELTLVRESLMTNEIEPDNAPNAHFESETTEDTAFAESELQLEKSRLIEELNAVKLELKDISQKREEKSLLLQSEVEMLRNQVIHLSANLNREANGKQELASQLERLQIVLEKKEIELTDQLQKDEQEAFVDKLMQQINILNDEKLSFETLFHNSQAELNLAKTNLADITQMIENQKDNINYLQETNNHVKLAQTLVSQFDSKGEAGQVINEWISEIDKCIGLLSDLKN